VLLTGSTRHGAGYDIDAAGLEYLSDPIIPTTKYRLEKRADRKKRYAYGSPSRIRSTR